MNARTFPFAAAMLAAPMLFGTVPVSAGQLQMMPGPTPDADALAAEMRILGSNPFDLRALITSGELTLKLGDIDAAAAFFQRAERISPNNGEIKSGKARTLVQLGRPGEALRLFGEAEALGYDVDSVGAERALAFDLIGDQERAQRSYRRALKRQNDDETQRRYALSLGISGKRDLALEQIDGLLRRSDRAAWRVRAFVLAMAGDVPGAERIATSMLPGDMASGLQPFFRILPTLSAADRAFAVHFGEVRTTPERIADARLVPVLPPLPYEAPPVQVAAQTAPVGDRALSARDRRRARGRSAAVAALPPTVPSPPQLPLPPRVVMVSPVVRAAPTPAMPTSTTPPTRIVAQPLVPPVSPQAAESPVVLASRSARAPSATPGPTVVTPPPPHSMPAAIVPVREAPSVIASVEARPQQSAPVETPPRVAAAPVELAKLDRAAPPPMVREVAASGSIPVPPPPAAPPVPDTQAPAVSPPVAAQAAGAVTPPAAETSRPAPIASEESILARIIATIGVPAAELGVGPVAAKPVEAAAADQPIAGADASKQAALDKKAAEKKAAAEKAAAEKKLADKKAADEKAAKAKASKADPARIWVQVAGGSSVRDLPREWAKLRDKAPAAFKARAAYTTPLRFTNRVLAGPFKSEDEAQGFVNQIAKSGLTGFVFTSEAGQKIDKLPTK